MSEKWQFGILTALAGVAMMLVLVNIIIFSGNRNLQEQVANRNLYIQQSLQLERIYQPLIRGLAELSARTDDAQLRELLASLGITFTVNPSQPATATEPPPQPPESNKTSGAQTEGKHGR